MDGAEAAPARVKGLSFRSVLLWYASDKGHDELVRRTREFHPWVADALAIDEPACGVIVNRWYRADVVAALADTITRDVSPREFERIAQGCSEWVARDTIRGLYRVLFDWVATPNRFVKYGARVWANYYDHGSFILHAKGERSIEAVVTDWAAYHPFVFALTRKVVCMMFDNMGCETRDLPAHREEGAQGVNAFEIAWSGGKPVDVAGSSA